MARCAIAREWERTMYYLLLYDVVDDFIARRAPFREAHLARVREAHGRGDLLLAGAFADPVDGAALVFTTDDRSVAERFAERDPYVQNRLVTDWRVRAWNVVTGAE
ncbi:MAG: YciI-like protein [Thermomicrobiales bacterium]